MEKQPSQEELMALLSERAWCYCIPPNSYVEGYGFRVSVVIDGVSGHFPTGTWPYECRPGESHPWFWGHDEEEAHRICEQVNAERGVDAHEAARIVSSSIAAEIKTGKRRRAR